MIEIRQYQEGDIDSVRRDPLEQAVKSYPDMHPQDYTLTALMDGEVIGVGGIVMLWEGVAEGWILLAEEVLDFKVATYKCLVRMVDKAIKDNNLRRLEAVIRTDFPQAVKMAERLGFNREGKKIGYCPDGQDVWIYARCK